MTWNYKAVEPSRSVDEICISCGNPIEKVRWRNAIEPRKGFIAESKTKEVPLRKPERSYKREDYYIGDPTCKVMYKKTFRIFDDEKLQMETSANDSLMVVCNDHFYVCNKCGYAISSTSGKEEKAYNSFSKSYKKNHKSPWGKDCEGILYRKDLCHSFKTDVVRITFGTSRAKNQSTMLSVMYTILEAISSVLDIERSESYCKLKVVGTNISSEALFIWKDKKILVFDNDNEKIDICGWTSLYVSEIKPMKFAEIL